MTSQIPDTFLFKGKEYELIGMEGGMLVSPEVFGLKPEMMHTACYRGFYATYQLTMDSLTLKDLTVRDRNAHYPTIEGIEPKQCDSDSAYVYRDLDCPIEFTGKIRLARDFIQELYIHMGYQKPTAFKEVLDITINQSKVIEVKDRSEEISQKRGEFKKHYESGTIISRIEDAFSMDLKFE